jgi:Mce-associated membrane protein
VVVPPAPDDTGLSDPTTHETPARTTSPRLVVAGALVLVLLVAAVASAVLVTQRGFDAVGIDRGATEVQDEREAVMSQARQFMLRANTYGPEQLGEDGTLGDYRSLVEEVITPKLSTSFQKEVTAAEQIVAQTGATRSTEVFSTGVATLDDDSATALVAGTFTTSYPDEDGKPQPTEPVPFRVQVSLVKTDGEWLVDDFDPITEAQQ